MATGTLRWAARLGALSLALCGTSAWLFGRAWPLLGALLAAACSALCFMAPVSAHRLTFRQGGKERLVWVTHGLALVGLALLAIAMLASIWLVLAYLFTWVTASATVAALAFLVLALWVVIPLRMRTRR